jgi:hypothetical protein
MARGKRAPSARGARTVVVEEEDVRATDPDPIERILEKVEPHPPSSAQMQRPAKKQAEVVPGMRTARIAAMPAGKVQIAFRGAREPVEARLADGVERELVALAMKNRDVVLIEVEPNGAPLIVGVVQTRIPRDVVIKADTVHIEAERELLLRSKTAAVRLREDGDVEIVGSRILALSRGLFRLVGRVLRLN